MAEEKPAPGRARRWLATFAQGIVLIVFSLVVVFILGEIAIRIYLNNADDRTRALYDYVPLGAETIRYTGHPYLDFMPRPGFEEGNDRHNALGFRGPEITVPKPEGVFRIVVLGGSVTYGEGVGDWRQADPAQLEQVLREEYGYSNVEVINAGVGGYTTWENVIDFEMRILDLEPDLAIINPGGNDVHARLVRPEWYRGDNSGYRIQWALWRAQEDLGRFPSALWRFIAINAGWVRPLQLGHLVLREYYCCLTSAGYSEQLGMTPDEALDANPPIYYRRNLVNFIAIARANDVIPVLSTFAYNPTIEGDSMHLPHYQRGVAEHNAIILELGQEYDVPAYDFAAEMPLQGPNGEIYYFDGVHMSGEGNRRKAELFAAFLVENNLIPAPPEAAGEGE